MTWIAGIPLRIGTGYRWYSFLFNRKVYEHRKDARRHELEYNLNLLQTIECPVEPQETVPRITISDEVLHRMKKQLADMGIREAEKIVVLHPGSGGSARDWPVRNFGELARQLSLLGNVRVIVTGGRNEANLVADVRRIGGPQILTIVDQLTLKELAALAKISTLFIANSTGPLHLAATVGTRVIGLYPQVTALRAERWGPYTSRKVIFTPVGKPHDCTECLHSSGDCVCMSSISVGEVYRAAVDFLSKDRE